MLCSPERPALLGDIGGRSERRREESNPDLLVVHSIRTQLLLLIAFIQTCASLCGFQPLTVFPVRITQDARGNLVIIQVMQRSL